MPKGATVHKVLDEGRVMEFTEFNNYAQRPYIVYAYTERTKLQVDAPGILHKHFRNCRSCVCYYGHSQKRLWSYVGDDSFTMVLSELNELAEAILMKHKYAIAMSDEAIVNSSNFKVVMSVINYSRI